MEFTFGQIAVARDRTSPVTLTVMTDDADGDPVSVQWAVTRGLLDGADQGTPSMRWSVVNATGIDTITVTAEDGKGGQTVIKPTVRVTNTLSPPTGTTTWLKSDSPYLLETASGTTFGIGSGAVVTIEAGVELIVNIPDMEFLVQGTLTTQGTATEPVSFVYNAVKPERGVWAGITANPDQGPPALNLTHTHISHAKTGVKALRSTQASLTNCKIVFCAEAAVLHQGNSTLDVIDCVITNNEKSGIRIDQAFGSGLPASITIRGDSIAFNGDLTGETAYTVEAGISINLSDPQASTVPITIDGNHISINGFPGIRITGPLGGALPAITGNSIFGNERNKNPAPRYNLRLEPGFDGPGAMSTIDATNNYWVVVDSIAIGQQIYDRRDNVSIETTVQYSPWLTGAP